MEPYDFETNDWCVFAGCTKLEDDRQSFETVIQAKEKMTNSGHARCSDMRVKRQSFDIVMNLEKKLTIHSHMRNPKRITVK